LENLVTPIHDPSQHLDGIGDGMTHVASGRLAGALAILGGIDPALADVVRALNLRIYPSDAADDRTRYVVLDIHGVSVGLKRRAHDLYLHIDTTETGDHLVAFEANGGGEIDHDIT
jgi:hypothetical protein